MSNIKWCARMQTVLSLLIWATWNRLFALDEFVLVCGRSFSKQADSNQAALRKKKLPPIRRERNGILAPLKRRAWYAQRRSCIKCCHIACHATKLLLTCVCIVRESNMRTAPKVRTPYLAGPAKQFWISLRLGWGEQRFWCTRVRLFQAHRARARRTFPGTTSSRELNLRFINFQPFV